MMQETKEYEQLLPNAGQIILEQLPDWIKNAIMVRAADVVVDIGHLWGFTEPCCYPDLTKLTKPCRMRLRNFLEFCAWCLVW